jgi:hypothetical protein
VEEIAGLAETFPPLRPARALLREAGFPLTEIPGTPDTALEFWEQAGESIASVAQVTGVA